MLAYVNGIRPDFKVRVYPYVAIHEGQSGWLNLRREPDRMETDLEDFRAWTRQPAIRTFFGLLRWLNSDDSLLESCDCAFRAPRDQDFEPSRAMCADGRLMVLFRDLSENCSIDRVRWLCEGLEEALVALDPELGEEDGLIEIWATPALHLELSRCRFTDGQYLFDDDDPGLGHHLYLQYFAFGNDEATTFAMLDRVFANLRSALGTVNELIKASAPLEP